MQPETVYVPGADVRAAWEKWNDALAARCEHELACLSGCDTRDRFCEIGLALVRAESAAWLVYHLATLTGEAAA